jgi:CBS domain-containing protein
VIGRLKQWLQEETATSTTEYAIIVALIAGSLMLASDAVRLAAESNFHRVGSTLSTGSVATTPTAGESNRTTERNVISDRPLIALAPMPWSHLLAWGTLLCAVAIVIFNRYRERRAQRCVQEIDLTATAMPSTPANLCFEKRQEILVMLLRHFDNALESRIEVRHVMSRKVRAADPEASLSDLRALMKTEQFHHLLVLKQGKLLGVISDRDLASHRGSRAKDIMTRNPVVMTPGNPIGHAITTLLHSRISCLPVVEEGEVKGILTTTDLLMTLHCLIHLVDRWQGEQASAGAAMSWNAEAMEPVGAS